MMKDKKWIVVILWMIIVLVIGVFSSVNNNFEVSNKEYNDDFIKEIIIEDNFIKNDEDSEDETILEDLIEDSNKVIDSEEEEDNKNNNVNNGNEVSNNNSNKNEEIIKEDESTNKDDTDNSIEENPSVDESIEESVIINTSMINLSDYSSDIKIIKGGTYTITGVLRNAIFIETDEKVVLNLNNVKITAKKTSAIANIKNNDLVIHLNEDTVNTLADGGSEDGLYDGCIYSNGEIIIEGNGKLIVKGQQVDGEGIATKNAPITINSGKIDIVSIDDGINTGGNGGTITINGGEILINAGGDGIDSNKDIVINGGIVYAIGSANGADSGVDADSGVEINGGTLIATGAAELGPLNTTSKQNSIIFAFSKLKASDKLITLIDENDNVIVSFIPYDAFSTLLISTETLKDGKYYLYQNGTNTGELENGIYNGGIYEKGNILDIDGNTEFIVDGIINGYSTINSLNIIEDNSDEEEIYNIIVNSNIGSNNIGRNAKVGEYVVLDINSSNEYIIKEILVKDVHGNEIEIIDNGFIMPKSNVIIDIYYEDNLPDTADISLIVFIGFIISLLGIVVFVKERVK